MSVVGQSFSDIEVILVDDGSPDRCPQMCDAWARRDSRIRVIHKQNGGLSDARNAGLDIASGDLITFVDSDDFLDLDTYRQVVTLSADADIVEFPVACHFGSPWQRSLSLPSRVYDDMADYWLEGRAYEHTYAWNKIYRRELFSDVRFPVGRVFEDVATLPLLLVKAQRVLTTDKGRYYYCLNKNGITSTADGERMQMLLDHHLKVLRRWCDDSYYMHVLNIQADVCELTGKPPLLPMRRVNPFSASLSPGLRMKAMALRVLGIKNTCKLIETLHRWKKPSRS